MALLALPKYFAVTYNGRFLAYVEDGDLKDYVGFLSTDASSPLIRFEVRKSSRSDSLVHIKCTSNNKYLVRASSTWRFFVARATNPVEDMSRWDCTLFQVNVIEWNANKPIELHHWSRNRLYGVFSYNHFQAMDHPKDPKYNGCLCVDLVDAILTQHYRVTDLATRFIMPQHVVFKGDNGKYLKSRWIQSHEYHEYSADDIRDPSTWYDVVMYPNGTFRIKSRFFNKFWRRSPTWIWADATEDTARNLDTVFQLVHLGGENGNLIALKNLGNNKFCKRLTADRKTSCLNASDNTVTLFSEIEVEEAVRMREIYDVEYNLTETKIYDAENPEVLTKPVSNGTSSTIQGAVSFMYTEKVSETWDTKHSWKVGVSTRIKTGIPVLAQGTISINTSYEGSIAWGQAKETTNSKTFTTTFPVPPWTKVTCTMAAAKTAIDIPFSYTQEDVLLSGSTMKQRLHDGIFTGVNTFVTVDLDEESLPRPSEDSLSDEADEESLSEMVAPSSERVPSKL